ncbi:MAG: DNA polymerase III subunit delta [Firmicutes bacterium]|nr:DNA polymerase III subunit delta [Bacillota bacterium]
MLYLLYGLEKYLINKEIKSILEKHKIERINVSNYNLEESNFKDIIDDAQTISMFGDKKAIIVDNSYIFTGKNIKSDSNPDDFLEYFKNINPDTILIFNIIYEKLDERKKIVKEIKKLGVIKDFNKSGNLNSIVKEMFDNYEISFSDINLLIDRVGNNLEIISQEVDKIKCYKDNNKNITKEDIINLTSRNIDIDIFAFIDMLINKNKEKTIETYYEMLKNGEEPIKVLIMLANQFRIMYQAKELYKKGYTGNDIATKLGIHPYRIKLALEKVTNYDSNMLLNYISKLADLDYDIKSGNIDAALGLELFILGEIK